MARNSLIGSFLDQFLPWAMNMMNFKDYVELTSDLDNSEIQGNLKVTTFLKAKESWWNYDFYPEIPYIVAHYLKLNLTFVEPTLWDLNITTKQDWMNLALKVMREEQIDYVLDPMFLSEEMFHPEAITLSSGMFGVHQLSIMTTKDVVSKDSFDEVKIFDTNVWWCLIFSVILNSLLPPFILRSTKSIPNLLFSLLSLLISQSSKTVKT